MSKSMIRIAVIAWTECGLLEDHEKWRVEGNALGPELELLDDVTESARLRVAKQFNAGLMSREEYVAKLDALAAEHELDERKAVVNASSVSRGRIWRTAGGTLVMRTRGGDRIVGELAADSPVPHWIPEIEIPKELPAVISEEAEKSRFEAKLDAIMARLGLDTDDAPRVDVPPEHS